MSKRAHRNATTGGSIEDAVDKVTPCIAHTGHGRRVIRVRTECDAWARVNGNLRVGKARPGGVDTYSARARGVGYLKRRTPAVAAEGAIVVGATGATTAIVAATGRAHVAQAQETVRG